jgi:hypothetical protein
MINKIKETKRNSSERKESGDTVQFLFCKKQNFMEKKVKMWGSRVKMGFTRGVGQGSGYRKTSISGTKKSTDNFPA